MQASPPPIWIVAVVPLFFAAMWVSVLFLLSVLGGWRALAKRYPGPPPTADVQMLGGADVEDPSCPRCGHSLREWGDMLDAWFSDQAKYSWSCPVCSHRSRPWDLDWHHTWGFGRYSVDVWHVRHGEARPHPELLEALQATTRAPWSYFYYHL